MKTILKAAACTVLTLVCALVFSTLLMNAIGMNPESVALDEYSDRMLEARSLFVEKNEDFQALAAALKEHTGLQILQTAGGEPVCMDNGEVIPAQDILSALEPDPALRWAALLHDTGKPLSFTRDEKGIGHFHGHAQISAEIAETVLRRLKASNALREQVVFLIAHHMDDINADKNQLRRKLSKYGFDSLTKLVKFQYADRVGTGKATTAADTLRDKTLSMLEELEQEEGPLQIRDLALDGHDLMQLGFAPGPELGQCQKQLLEQVLDGQIPNEKDALLQKAKEYLEQC